jgi:hypothetical protein
MERVILLIMLQDMLSKVELNYMLLFILKLNRLQRKRDSKLKF